VARAVMPLGKSGDVMADNMKNNTRRAIIVVLAPDESQVYHKATILRPPSDESSPQPTAASKIVVGSALRCSDVQGVRS